MTDGQKALPRNFAAWVCPASECLCGERWGPSDRRCVHAVAVKGETDDDYMFRVNWRAISVGGAGLSAVYALVALIGHLVGAH